MEEIYYDMHYIHPVNNSIPSHHVDSLQYKYDQLVSENERLTHYIDELETEILSLKITLATI